jgi:AcrR family transcriptional regulator
MERGRPKPSPDERLTRRDWQRAALEALIAGGMSAVTVPQLAAALGVTKGSFYWHFESVDDLLKAALEDWERIFTDERLATFATVPGRRKLEIWMREAETAHPAQRLHLAIASAADHPVIGAAFARVAAKRIAFIAGALHETGSSPREAQARAVAAYAAYLGFLRLAQHAPMTVGRGRKRAGLVRRVFAALAADV